MNRKMWSFVAMLIAGIVIGFASAQTTVTGSYEFQGPVFDIAAVGDGSILVTEGLTVRRITASGVESVVVVPTVEGSPVNGLAAFGGEGFLLTSGGLDLAVGAGVWRVVDGTAHMVADIEAFESARDPDATEGSRWKDLACEDDSAQGFTAGPQSNPYHLTVISEITALVADAAGNSLLSTSVAGDIDWVAVFDPPVDENGEWRFFRPAENDPDVDCYVQPVPTSVAVGPDGAYYVGELTGTPAVPGWSRVWRIAPGAMNVVCPSDLCEEVLSGLTSVIDVAFGPDGRLYVAEMDQAGWLSLIVGGSLGGAIKRCDVETGECSVVAESELPFMAIAFDPMGQLWVAENEGIGPGVGTVRTVDLP